MTAVISYLAYSVRRQKPNVSSKGRILLVAMLCFLYMSLDKTADCEKSIAECIAFFSGDSIEGISLLFWQTVVYGAILLCLVSQILFEFSGTIVSQTVIFCGAIFYAIASGCCFIPAESWKIPIPVIQVVTGAILLGDFCFFWAMLNYTRFVLLDGFGLLDSGWSIAMNDYKRQMRKRPLKSSGYSAGLLEEETEQKATDEIILPEKSESDNLENGLDSSRINLLPPELTEKQPPITTLESPIYTTETLSTSTPVYGSGVSQYSINSITAPVQSAPVQSVPIQSAPIQSVPVSSTGAPISSSRTVPPKPAAPAVPPVSAAPTPLEVQQEFIRVEAQIKRKLTHEEKKSVIRRMLKQRKNSV